MRMTVLNSTISTNYFCVEILLNFPCGIVSILFEFCLLSKLSNCQNAVKQNVFNLILVVCVIVRLLVISVYNYYQTHN